MKLHVAQEIAKAIRILRAADLHLASAFLQEALDPHSAQLFPLTVEEGALLREGHKIEAIKAVRTRTGLCLADSKSIVDMHEERLLEERRKARTKSEPLPGG